MSVVEEMYDNPRVTDEEIYCEAHSYKNPFATVEPYSNHLQMVLFQREVPDNSNEGCCNHGFNKV